MESLDFIFEGSGEPLKALGRRRTIRFAFQEGKSVHSLISAWRIPWRGAQWESRVGECYTTAVASVKKDRIQQNVTGVH
jgi:hypothetical protein